MHWIITGFLHKIHQITLTPLVLRLFNRRREMFALTLTYRSTFHRSLSQTTYFYHWIFIHLFKKTHGQIDSKNATTSVWDKNSHTHHSKTSKTISCALIIHKQKLSILSKSFKICKGISSSPKLKSHSVLTVEWKMYENKPNDSKMAQAKEHQRACISNENVTITACSQKWGWQLL